MTFLGRKAAMPELHYHVISFCVRGCHVVDAALSKGPNLQVKHYQSRKRELTYLQARRRVSPPVHLLDPC